MTQQLAVRALTPSLGTSPWTLGNPIQGGGDGMSETRKGGVAESVKDMLASELDTQGVDHPSRKDGSAGDPLRRTIAFQAGAEKDGDTPCGKLFPHSEEHPVAAPGRRPQLPPGLRWRKPFPPPPTAAGGGSPQPSAARTQHFVQRRTGPAPRTPAR